MRICRILTLLAVLGGSACDSDTDETDDPSDIDLSTTVLTCPSVTLTLMIRGGFPKGTTVQFDMDGTLIDGSPVILDDGSIDCGLPSDAAPGDYDVVVDGKTAGTVTLDATNC